jgi:hypothetical protein
MHFSEAVVTPKRMQEHCMQSVWYIHVSPPSWAGRCRQPIQFGPGWLCVGFELLSPLNGGY